MVHRATLAEVARASRVSVTTASYILSGRAAQMRISEATQSRVRAAAHELGYRPNRIARNLRTASTRTIGFLSDAVASGHFANAMVAGAIEEARRRDHLLLVAESNGDPELEEKLIDELLEWRVDGIIYATYMASRVDVPSVLHGQHVVLLNCDDPNSGLSTVLPDDHGGGRIAAEALGLVSGDIVCMVGSDTAAEALASRSRKAGVLEVLAETGAKAGVTIECDWDVHEAFDATDAWLRDGGVADALVCMNDRVAMGVVQALSRHGRRIPDDLSVVSFDGSELAGWLYPAVDSVAIPFAEMGVAAVATLLDRDRVKARVEIAVPMRLSPGASIRPAR